MPLDDRLAKLFGYFQPTLLAVYRAEPDKYRAETDFFEGRVCISDAYYMGLPPEQRREATIDLEFGFRTQANGELAIAAFRPDLVEKSPGHVAKWRGFALLDPEWLSYEKDERFSLWVRRYLEGDWDVQNGPGFDLIEQLRLINGLTREACGCRLFAVNSQNICYPVAQNRHAYEDAHLGLYRILIDGIDKTCIEQLSVRLGHRLAVSPDNTVKALTRLLPRLSTDEAFVGPIKNVSEQRRMASHKERPPALPHKAFEAFTGDLERCARALVILRADLEKELSMDASASTDRQDAMDQLSRIVLPPEATYSVNSAKAMIGKTVERVECGLRQGIPGVHQSEVLIVYFTDGSVMSVDTGSNASNILTDGAVEVLNVDLHVAWVPPRQKP